MITDGHLPGKGNPNSRPNENVPADFSAKETPSKPPPRIKHLRRRSHKKGIKNPPKLNEPSGPFANAIRQPKSCQVLKFPDRQFPLPAQGLIRRNRSASAAASNTPSRITQPLESPWYALMPSM